MASQDDDWTDICSFNTAQKPNGNLKSVKLQRSSASAKRFYDSIHDRSDKRLKDHKSPIFTTNVDGAALYGAYLGALLVDKRAEHNCAACRRFIKRHGGLALVSDDGTLTPLFWDTHESDRRYADAVNAMYSLVKTARVVKLYKPVHDNRNARLGLQRTDNFNHFYYDFPPSRLSNPELRAFALPQAAELAAMLSRLLEDFSKDTVKKAHMILAQHKLPNAHNHIAAIKYLSEIYGDLAASKQVASRHHNLLYRYAANAFVGCLSQLRTGPLSILLDLIQKDSAFDLIKRKWKELTDPTVYMRPTAAPSVGSVETAEKLFNDLGLTANDMRRRFLTHADLPDVKLWQRTVPPAPKPKTDIKIFSSLLPPKNQDPKPASNLDLPATPITFARLITHILPKAKRAYIRLTSRHSITFFISGLPDSKPLMQWHTPSNLVSSYVYRNPRHVSKHNLQADAWNEITAVLPAPWLWDLSPDAMRSSLRGGEADPATAAVTENYVTKKNGVAFALLLDKVVDNDRKSLCLFPSWMKGEFHGVRKVIERYSNEGMKEEWNESEVKEQGGFVGGVSVMKGGKAFDGSGKLLIKTEGSGKDGSGEGEGVWEVVCFE